MALFEEELSYEMRGCFFDVQKQVGFGLPEEAYHRALVRAFAVRGISAKSKEPILLKYKDLAAVELIPDFIVANRIVLDLKSLRENFAREHEIQLFSYLKATRLRLGYLVNFGRERVIDIRRVFDEKPYTSTENWELVKGRIDGLERETMATIRTALLTVGQTFGLGYGDGIYWKLLTAVLNDAGRLVNLEPLANPFYNEQRLGDFPVDCAVVDECVICVVTALKEGLSPFDLARAESFVRNLGQRFGVVANFGKEKLEIRAVATV